MSPDQVGIFIDSLGIQLAIAKRVQSLPVPWIHEEGRA
jgi:hypothetical protein